MADYQAGTASIRILPDASGFLRDLEAKLRAMRDPGFDVRLELDSDEAARDAARFRQEQARRGVEMSIEAQTAGAAAQMAAWRQAEELRHITLSVDIDTTGAAAKLAGLRAAAGGGGFGGGGGSGVAGGAARSGGPGFLGALAALGGVAVGSLPAVVTLTADLAGAIKQLSGAGLLLPGVIAGVATSVGTAKLAFSGLDEALEAVLATADGSPESLKAAEEALKGLPPAARDLVTALAELQPKFTELRTLVQQNMFEGLPGQIKDLVDRQFPTVTRGLADVASAWNGTFSELLDVGDSQGMTRLLDRVFGDTADAQRIVNEAIDPLTSAISTLVGAGADGLPRIAGDVQSVSERFDEWMSGAAFDGRLDKWINAGITGLEDLGNTGINVADIFSSIADAAPDNLLSSLEGLTDGWADYLNSAEGQRGLNDLVAEGSDQIDTFMDTMGNLGPAAKIVFDQATTSVGVLNETLNITTGVLEAILTKIPFVSDALRVLANPLKTVLDNWQTAQDKADEMMRQARDKLPVVTPVNNARPSGGLGNAADATMGAAENLNRYGAQAAAVQDKIDALGDSVRTLPTGEVVLTENTPEVMNKVEALELRVKEIDGKLYIAVDDTAANATMEAFINRWSKAIINPRLSVPGQGPAVGQPGQISPGNPFALPPVATPGPPRVSPSATFPFPLPTGATGGPTPSGRGPGPTGGYLAEIHSNEWVLPEHARAAVGDRALWALTKGRSFASGGYVDQYGNPVTPGPAPGPVASVAPNPYSSGNGSIANSFLSGLSGVAGNLSGLLNVGAPAGQTAGTGVKLIPGLWGLAQAGNDPNLLAQWGSQTGDWLGNFAAKTFMGFGSTLYKGLLGMVGLENSILSPDNALFQAGAKSAGFFLGGEGPVAGLLGGTTDTGSGGTAPTEKQLRDAQDKITDADGRVAETAARLNELAADAKESTRLSAQNQATTATREAQQARDDYAALQNSALSLNPTTLQQLHGNGGMGVNPSAALSLPAGPGDESGLQPATLAIKRLVNAQFPEFGDIGGVRADGLKWHPGGLAIDVMIPGGTTRGGVNPNGKTAGDRLFAYLNANKDALGIDHILWQTDSGGDHYNHVHVATKQSLAGSVPGYLTGGHISGPGTGTSDDILARLSNGEFVTRAKSVEKYGVPFMSALNDGHIDPEMLPKFAQGGMPLGAVPQPPKPPRPNFKVPDIKQLEPKTPQPKPRPQPQQPKPQQPAPTAPQPLPPVATPAPPAPAPPVAQQQPVAPTYTPEAGGSVAPPGETDHTLPWVNTAIESGAATIGALADSAVAAASMGASMGMGGGMSGIGQLSIGGMIQQGGKIVKDIANVVSSAMVGSVPGSFMTTPEAYGRTLTSEQTAPQTALAQYGGGRVASYGPFYGHDKGSVMQDIQLHESIEQQSIYANHPGRI